MTPPAPPVPATDLPDDPVRTALEDPDVQDKLRKHAHAMLSRWLADRKPATRAEAVQDVLQETASRALKNRAKFDPAVGTSVAGWLHGFLNNVVSEHCRALRKLPAQQPDEVDAWDNLAGQVDRVQDTEELLRLLPEKQRQFVQLHVLDGLSHQEIGRRLNISPGHSRVKLNRAMKMLRELVAGKEGQR